MAPSCGSCCRIVGVARLVRRPPCPRSRRAAPPAVSATRRARRPRGSWLRRPGSSPRVQPGGAAPSSRCTGNGESCRDSCRCSMGELVASRPVRAIGRDERRPEVGLPRRVRPVGGPPERAPRRCGGSSCPWRPSARDWQAGPRSSSSSRRPDVVLPGHAAERHPSDRRGPRRPAAAGPRPWTRPRSWRSQSGSGRSSRRPPVTRRPCWRTSAARSRCWTTTDQPPLDRCTGYVVVAAALNTLQLWELVDEMYTRAAELSPICEEPRRRRPRWRSTGCSPRGWSGRCALLEDRRPARREPRQAPARRGRGGAGSAGRAAARTLAAGRGGLQRTSCGCSAVRDPLSRWRRPSSGTAGSWWRGSDLECCRCSTRPWALAPLQHGHVSACPFTAAEGSGTRPCSSSSGARNLRSGSVPRCWPHEACRRGDVGAAGPRRPRRTCLHRESRAGRARAPPTPRSQWSDGVPSTTVLASTRVNTDALTGLEQPADLRRLAAGPAGRGARPRTALLLVDLDGFKAAQRHLWTRAAVTRCCDGSAELIQRFDPGRRPGVAAEAGTSSPSSSLRTT